MKTTVILVTLLCLTFSLTAQTEALQKEIDRQVWQPFHDAYEARNAKALNAIYASEVLRVTPAGIDTQGLFKQKNEENYARTSSQNAKTLLDFWFESRHTNADTSYEVGMFRIKTITNGKESTFYGQFHIVVKKINGLWKITQDWDNSIVNGKTLSAEDFARKPVEF